MNIRIALTASALVLLGAAHHPPFTLEVARGLSREALEQRVFQAVRGTVREAEVYGLQFDPFRSRQRAQFGIDFADAPVATALPGLCAVQVRTAIFGQGEVAKAGKDAATHLLEISEETRYALRLSAPGALSLESRASCDDFTPVLGNRHFFQVHRTWPGAPATGEVIVAVRSLQRVVDDAVTGQLSNVACTEDMFSGLGGRWAPLCADAAASIAKLRWEYIDEMTVTACKDGRLCVDVYLPRPTEPAEASRKVDLAVEVSGAKADLTSAVDIGRVTSVSLVGVTAVD